MSASSMMPDAMSFISCSRCAMVVSLEWSIFCRVCCMVACDRDLSVSESRRAGSE